MKNALAVCGIFLASIASFAGEPGVGNSSTQTQVTTTNGKVETLVVTRTMKAVDKSNNAYVVHVHMLLEDGRQIDGDWTSTKENLWYVEDTAKFCKEKVGTLEVVTVPAGDISTCKVEHAPNLTYWYSSDVPFGVVKILDEQKKGKQVETRLTNFSW